MKTRIANLVGVGAVFLLSACSSVQTGYTGLKMACLPEALIMKSALTRENIRSKILTVRYAAGAKELGHAVLLFRMAGKTAAWDSTWGSIAIGAQQDYSLNAATLGAMYIRRIQAQASSPLTLHAAFIVDGAAQEADSSTRIASIGISGTQPGVLQSANR